MRAHRAVLGDTSACAETGASLSLPEAAPDAVTADAARAACAT
jgi:hypothetical protein